MKLYTFQPNFVWEAIQKDGFYHPFDLFEKNEFLKEDLAMGWGFSQAYIWLKEKMLQKGIVHKKYNQHMIWGWYQWSGTKSKPDKRYSSVYSFYDEPFVMLELDIDSSRVLLTDYDSWHFVLNYWFLGKEQETDKFSESFNYYKEKPLLDLRGDAELRKSWEHIFDLEKVRTLLEYPREQQCVQATFFDILKEDVKKVHFFDNKKCIKIENFN